MSSPQVQWDAPKPTNPPPQVKWDAPTKTSSEPKATLLSNIGLTEGPDVRITDYPHATLSGIQSIGRGVRGAVEGIGRTIAHPINTAKSLAELPSEAAQVPAAIHDINQSPDPVGTYAKVGQETAGQGAGQALTALGTEGLTRVAPKVIPPVIRGVARGTNTVLKRAPGMIGSGVGAAVGHEVGAPGLGAAIGYGVGREVLPRLRIPGEDFGIPKPVYPGAHLPENPGQLELSPKYPGAHLPDNPGELTLNPKYPGAHLPVKPAPELLQARGIGQGARAPSDPAASLGRIPVRDAEASAPPIAKPSGDPILDRLRANAAKIEREGHGDEIPEDEEATPQTSNLNDDLTPALKKSLAKFRAAKRVQLAKPKSSSASAIQ